MPTSEGDSHGREDGGVDRRAIGAAMASRVRQAMHVGRGRVHDLAWSPDGQTLAAATAAGVWVYNLAAPDAAPRLFASPAQDGLRWIWWKYGDSITGASAIAINPSGKLVAGAFSDGSICIWDMASGQERRIANASPYTWHRILFDNSGRQLIAGGEHAIIADGYEHRAGVVHIWDLDGGDDPIALQSDSWVVDVALGPQDTYLAFATFDGTIRRYDLDQRREVALRSFPMGATYDMELGVTNIRLGPTAEGVVLVVRPEDTRVDNFVCLWRPDQPDEVQPTNLPLSWQSSLPAVSPDGRTLAWREDNTIVLWNWRSGETVTTLRGAHGLCSALSFSPDGRMLAANDAHALRVWRIDNPDSLYLSFDGHGSRIERVLVDEDATTVVTTNQDRVNIYKWDGWQVAGPPLHLTQPRSFVRPALSSRGLLACVVGRETSVAGEDGDSVWLYDVARQRALDPLPHHRIGFASGGVAFSPDGCLLAVCGGHRDRSVSLWDVNTMTRRAVLGGHNWGVHKVVFSPDGRWLASTGPNSTLLWNIETEALHMALPVVDGMLAFSPDSRLLATHGHPQPDAPVGIHLWDVQSGSLAHVLAKEQYRDRDALFSSDGRFLAMMYEYNLMQLLNLPTGTLHVRVANSGHFIFSPDGTVLATTSPSHSVYSVPRIFLWSVATGALLRTLTGHRARISVLTFSGDGTLLVSGDGDGIVRFWQVDPSTS